MIRTAGGYPRLREGGRSSVRHDAVVLAKSVLAARERLPDQANRPDTGGVEAGDQGIELRHHVHDC